jgi:hypothetical protein
LPNMLVSDALNPWRRFEFGPDPLDPALCVARPTSQLITK